MMFRAENHSHADLAPLTIRLPGLPDAGLGDAVKHVIAALGIQPCSRCQKRAEAMNRIRLAGLAK